MTHWHDTLVNRPEAEGAVYVTGWTISGLAVLRAVGRNSEAYCATENIANGDGASWLTVYVIGWTIRGPVVLGAIVPVRILGI